MASSAGDAPSTRIRPLQIGWGRRIGAARGAIEGWLKQERDQLPLWLPVAMGIGIVLWFVLPDPASWLAAVAASAGLGLATLARGTLLAALGSASSGGAPSAWQRPC